MPSDPKLKDDGSVFESITGGSALDQLKIPFLNGEGGSSGGSGTSTSVKHDNALILPVVLNEKLVSQDEPFVSPAPVVNHHHPLTEIVISSEVVNTPTCNQRISDDPQQNDTARINNHTFLTIVAVFLIVPILSLSICTTTRIIGNFEGDGPLLAWTYILFGILINFYTPLEKRPKTGLNNGCKEELKHFLHYIIALLSFLFYGLIPILVYIFTFRETDDKDLKVLAAAGATFPGFALLINLKTHFQKSEYWKDCVKVVLF